MNFRIAYAYVVSLDLSFYACKAIMSEYRCTVAGRRIAYAEVAVIETVAYIAELDDIFGAAILFRRLGAPFASPLALAPFSVFAYPCVRAHTAV